MSNIYKTPLFKSVKLDEKLGAEGKLIGLEDLVPSVAKKIENAVDKNDLNFAKDYGIDGLDGMFNYLNANNNRVISHGAYQSGIKEFTIDGAVYYYKQTVIWDEIKIKQTIEKKDNPFAGYESQRGATGLGYKRFPVNKIHLLHVVDVAAPATESGGNITVTVSETPVPDEVIAACSNGVYSLNVTYTELTTQSVYTPSCKSVLVGSDGNPIRESVFIIPTYNCIATMNYSTYPVEINAELIAFA